MVEEQKQDQHNVQNQLLSLWKKKVTEVVIAVLPTHTKGSSLIVHHSELLTLRPHQWLCGEVIEGLFNTYANPMDSSNSIYIMSHYTAGVILFGQRSQLARQSLSKVNFDRYSAILTFVNVNRCHWKLLYINHHIQTVCLVDLATNPAEKEESVLAAEKFTTFLKVRRIAHGKDDWVDVKWQGGVMAHPCQNDGNSCGVIVVMIAREIMKAFPSIPAINFSTSVINMKKERVAMGEQLLMASVFDSWNNCSLCSIAKQPRAGPPITNWIQCDTCERWFHEQCLSLPEEVLK